MEAPTRLARNCRYRVADRGTRSGIIKCIKAEQVIHVPLWHSFLHQRFAGILGREVPIANRLGKDSRELFGRIGKCQSLRPRD